MVSVVSLACYLIPLFITIKLSQRFIHIHGKLQYAVVFTVFYTECPLDLGAEAAVWEEILRLSVRLDLLGEVVSEEMLAVYEALARLYLRYRRISKRRKLLTWRRRQRKTLSTVHRMRWRHLILMETRLRHTRRRTLKTDRILRHRFEVVEVCFVVPIKETSYI